MAPLPTIPSDLYPSLKRRLDDIESFQIPRLTRCTGPIGLQRELAEETKSDLEQVRRSIEACYEVGESLGGDEREENRTICHAFEARLKGVRSEYRRAIIESKRSIASSSRHILRQKEEDVDELSQPQSSGGGGSMQDDALQTRTNEVTDALRRTTQTMQTELERSVLSVQMLEDSTRTLRSTTNLYETYTSLLEASGQIIKQLEKADWWDRLTILAAFLFFLLCVGWIIKRRILDRVVGGLGWWVFGSFRLIGMGLGMGARSKAKAGMDVSRMAVGAGKVGSTPDGMGRVGLAGGKEKPESVERIKVEPEVSIIDSVVPPVPSGESAITDQGRVDRDEL